MAAFQPQPNPLHTQNPLGRFSNRARDYASYRPAYPQAAVDYAIAGLGAPSRLVVADIGAGTGISSRLFAQAGAQVMAIEPNEAMRTAAEPHPQVTFQTGTAEQTGLADQSVDLITCFQSFHWFEPAATLAEFRRILKPTGRVALAWNERNSADPLTHDYAAAVRASSDEALFDRCDRRSPDALLASPLFHNFRQQSFFHDHRLSLEGLMGLALSSSYVRRGEADQAQLWANLQALCDRWAKPLPSESDSEADAAEPTLALSYETRVYLAEPTP
ncbi:MAG: methyltransferase domain-containing protein [Synechococcales bacterium]|nr:methyltransferase domain-containing protein [Synechococcales bacterium]